MASASVSEVEVGPLAMKAQLASASSRSRSIGRESSIGLGLDPQGQGEPLVLFPIVFFPFVGNSPKPASCRSWIRFLELDSSPIFTFIILELP